MQRRDEFAIKKLHKNFFEKELSRQKISQERKMKDE